MFYLLTAWAMLAVAGAFNVDVEHATVFSDPEGQSGSYFGYSVSLLKEPGFEGESWILAGAPKANSTFPNHYGITEPGVVYLCKIDERSNNCSPLTLDSSGNERVPAANGYAYMDRKDHAWIGAAIGVQNDGNGRIAICGPRWKNQFYSEFYLMNGICYWYSSSKDLQTYDAKKLIPLLRAGNQGYEIDENYDPDRKINEIFYYAYGGAGMSVDFVKNSTEMIVGAPGVFDWMGTVIRFKDRKDRFIQGRREITLSGAYTDVITPNPYLARKLSPSSYFGYAVGSGRFFRSTKTYYVGGAPRAGLLKGKVFIFDYPSSDEEPMIILVELTGSTLGEYFGSSICVVDLNKDGLDDLVVGAPLYSLESSSSIRQTGDEGRIYVFLNEDNGRMIEIGDQTKIMGSQQHGSRFGMSISNLGDLNNDGYPDIAVGAPYENLGSGVVYIYHGTKNGINPKYFQRIAALQIDHSIRGFGISITKGIDIDINHFNDFAVGAYESGHTILLKSRPIITFSGNIKPNVSKLDLNATGFLTRACLLYTGNYAPPSLFVAITLKADPENGRAHFVTKTGRNNTLVYIQELKHVLEYCVELELEILPSLKDFTKPIGILMNYSLIDTSSEDLDIPDNHRKNWKRDANGFCKSCPVVDPSFPTLISHKVPYVTGCGEIVCQTDLKTEVVLTNIKLPFLIGSAPQIQMKVIISNDGDPAFLADTRIVFPKMVHLIRIPKICQEMSSVNADKEVVLTCGIGNPLKHKETREFFLEFDTTDIPSGTDSLQFTFNTTSLGEELISEDNGKEITVPLKTVADITISGKASQNKIYLPKNIDSGSEKNYSFSHVYEVHNLGPSPVSQVKLVFKFPSMIKNGTEYLPFLRVYQPQANLDSQSFSCSVEGGEFYVDSLERGSFHELSQETTSQEKPRNKRNTKSEEDSVDINHSNIITSAYVSNNRTFYLNCSNSVEGCLTVTCITGPFKTPQSRAILIFPIKVDSKYFAPSLEEMDYILLSSTGSATILDFPDSIQVDFQKSDYTDAYTMFFGNFAESKVDSWIIAVAVAGGILILLLLVLGLVKIGFFERGKKMELEALKSKAELEKSFADEYE